MEQREATRQAYDLVGGSIEAMVALNPIVAWMRATSRRAELDAFPPGARLLEIGCGSGADAVFFARTGRHVVAIDISEEMVAVARAHAAAAGVADRVRVERGNLVELEPKLGALPGVPLDGAYANFSLAYEPSLRPVVEVIHRLLRPGARFVFSLPNRYCLIEALLFGGRLRFGPLADRWKGGLRWEVRGIPLRLRTYSPPQVARILHGLFRARKYRGIPVFMPPPLLYDRQIENGRRLLETLDDALAASLPFRLLGDTTLFDYQRIPET